MALKGEGCQFEKKGFTVYMSNSDNINAATFFTKSCDNCKHQNTKKCDDCRSWANFKNKNTKKNKKNKKK